MHFSDDVKIKQRTILWYLVFAGFSVNYMIRININISIVDMIDENFRKITNNTLVDSECIDISSRNFSNNPESSSNFTQTEDKRFPSLERMLLDVLGVRKASHVMLSLSRGALICYV